MLKVGLTGGIGSGKTIVSKIFHHLDIPVYYADNFAKTLSDTDPEIIEKLSDIFGKDIYTPTGLDRKKLASIIFRDPDALSKVNHIIHPKVREHFFKWCEQYSDKEYIIQEAAILFESGAYKFFDMYITVTAPETLRINRVLSREETTAERIKKIISNQISEDEKIKRSHFVIVNDEKKLVIPQVLLIHEKLLTYPK